jgi:hypothetical protein
LQTVDISPNPAINVSIFKPDDLKPFASSGIYTNKKSGVAISQITLTAGDYVIIPSSHLPQLGVFVVTVYSSGPFLLEKMN